MLHALSGMLYAARCMSRGTRGAQERYRRVSVQFSDFDLAFFADNKALKIVTASGVVRGPQVTTWHVPSKARVGPLRTVVLTDPQPVPPSDTVLTQYSRSTHAVAAGRSEH